MKNYETLLFFRKNFNDNIFKTLTDHIDEIFWLRKDNKMIYISPAFEEIWGGYQGEGATKMS